MKIEIISKSQADTDYTIAYIDGQPAAIVTDQSDDDIGYYGVVNDGEYVHCPYEGYRYYVDDGRWVSSHDSYPIPSEYIERDINDGCQGILYMDDVDSATLAALGLDAG